MTDREKLVVLVKEICNTVVKACGCSDMLPTYSFCKNAVYESFADYLITNGVTVHEWISTKDRLPEDEQEVIGCEGDYAEILYYDAEFNEWNDANGWRVKLDKFPHWMPLPELPKEE